MQCGRISADFGSPLLANFMRFAHWLTKMQNPSRRRLRQIWRRESRRFPVALEISQMNCEAEAFDTPDLTTQTHAQGQYALLYG
jgi:hypothetical protein